MISSKKTTVTAGPNFINIGPGRCASSWLLEVLEAHPEIGMAKIKETEFFNTNFERGCQWYESLFPAGRGKVVGEISNCYYTQPEVAQRIFNYNPDIKIIVNVRDPFSLLKSFHGFGVRRGLPLTEVQDDLDFHIGKVMGSGYQHREKKGRLTQGDTVTLLNSVMLSQHLKPFFDTFPANQIYVFVFERLANQSAEVIEEIYRFLDVDDRFQPPVAQERVNEAIQPKSKAVAQAAMKFAFLLRQVGAYRVLDQLKKSRRVKNLFYSKSAVVGESKDLRDSISAAVRREIENDMRALIALHPPLENWWSMLPGTLQESN